MTWVVWPLLTFNSILYLINASLICYSVIKIKIFEENNHDDDDELLVMISQQVVNPSETQCK